MLAAITKSSSAIARETSTFFMVPPSLDTPDIIIFRDPGWPLCSQCSKSPFSIGHKFCDKKCDNIGKIKRNGTTIFWLLAEDQAKIARPHARRFGKAGRVLRGNHP